MPCDEFFIHFRIAVMLLFCTQIDSSVRRSFAIPVEIIVITVS
jgi:hypothetical protein